MRGVETRLFPGSRVVSQTKVVKSNHREGVSHPEGQPSRDREPSEGDRSARRAPRGAGSPKPTSANVPVTLPSLAPSIAALVVVLVVFQIMAVGSRCTRQPSLLQSPWHLMLLSSSYVLPLLLSHPCAILLQP